MRKSLANFFSPLKKWWLMVLIATLAGFAAGFVGARSEPSTYLANVTLMVGNSLQQPNPEANQTYTAMLLSYTYAQLARSAPIADATRESLDLKVLPRYLAYALWDAPFVNIEVIDEDPQLTMVVANELARQLVLKSPAAAENEVTSQLVFLEQQLGVTQSNIQRTKQEIDEAQASLKTLKSASLIARANDRITALESKLTSLEIMYVDMLDAIQTGVGNQVTIFAPAQLPVKPFGPDKQLLTLLAGLSGFLLSVGAAYLYETYDVSVKTSAEASDLTGIPVIGLIGMIPGERSAGIYIHRAPHGPTADAFRSLRTNLDYLIGQKHIRTLLVTSPSPKEGKSTITANLSASLALADRDITLLDADLRRPVLHETVGISNLRGITEVYRGSTDLEDALVPIGSSRLSVLTSGELPPDPAELITSHRFQELLASLVSRSDLVVIDGPPATIADSMTLAARVDAVVLVVRAGYTPRHALMESVHQLDLVGANLVGIVINRSPEAAQEGTPLTARLRKQLSAWVNRVLGRQTLLPQKPPKYPLPRRRES